MKNKAVVWLCLMFLFVSLLLVINPTTTLAQQGNLSPAAQSSRLSSYLSLRSTVTPSHPVTPTPLPAEYTVEQTHPAMVAGAGVLVLIIIVGVLAFSRHKA